MISSFLSPYQKLVEHCLYDNIIQVYILDLYRQELYVANAYLLQFDDGFDACYCRM